MYQDDKQSAGAKKVDLMEKDFIGNVINIEEHNH